jgi:hypothetical protein
MTVPVPSYVRGRPLQWLWVKYWRLQCLIHSYKRNPNCNERRRYKDDTIFIAGTHKHLPPIWQGGHRFDRVSVPVQFFRSFEHVSVPVQFLRIETPSTLNKDDLTYLQINSVEGETDA